MSQLIGQEFGRLSVLRVAVTQKRGRKALECLCECGGTILALPCELTRGRITSCGCSQHKAFTAQKLASGEAAFRELYRSYDHNAAKREHIFELTIDEFRQMVTSECFYCGAEPMQECGRAANNGKFVYNGVDRVDNARGYTIDNCVACCPSCNRMKGHVTMEMIEKIHGFVLVHSNGTAAAS